jgi:hypothetical protein
MRITEGQLRRIVRQEILSEETQTATQKLDTKLDPVLGRLSSTITQATASNDKAADTVIEVLKSFDDQNKSKDFDMIKILNLAITKLRAQKPEQTK